MEDASVWDVARMQSLVAEWDEALRADVPAYARLLPEAEERGSILRPPATPGDVAATEDRLGVQLPSSYRSFLLIANGADGSAARAATVVRGLAATEERILDAKNVVAFADEDFLSWLVEMWRENTEPFADRQQVPDDDPVDVIDFEPGRRALLVTAPVQDGIVGLVPYGTEWQVWEFFHSDVRAHRSFADFLGFHARVARKRVAERAERARSVAIDGASFIDVGVLAEHGDPRALEAAREVLLDPGSLVQSKDAVARVLGFLGDAKAIPALREALAGVEDPAFGTSPEGLHPDASAHDRRRLVFTVLQALDLCGDEDALGGLERLVREEPPVAGYAAGYLKRREEGARW